ncbi:MAG: hypothetical protein U9Q82_06650 [Chloroflexota bacterium]|nr:hypothetical protein [Chloroflexota bacterium]
MAIRNPLLILLLLLSTGCTPFAFAPPPPTPQTVTVAHTPALRWMRNLLHACAVEDPGMALFTEEIPASSIDIETADISILIGSPPQGNDAPATLLGWEEIIIVSNLNIDAASLDEAGIRSTYTSLEPRYQGWTYLPGSELNQIFNAAVLGDKLPPPQTMLAPDPAAMLSTVAENANAIGYLPQSWLTDEVRTLPMSAEVENALHQPIIALTHAEPTGVIRTFLSCLWHLLEK